ncbi:MAG TPA: hypothetical protein VG938_13805 [Verrucomicrobiae bacterium]|jgi:hypothetical protein|nr:hypothetical protein [Verrucomicrobiae bacterium]
MNLKLLTRTKLRAIIALVLLHAAVSGANEIQNGGFETGDFQNWTVVDNSSGTFVDDGSGAGISPKSGKYLALLGAFGSLGSLSQTITTLPGQPYLISLWLTNPDDSTPNEFVVQWNGNILFDQTNIPALAWTNLQFTITATDTSGALQFGYLNEHSFFGLDDVSANVIPPALNIFTSDTNIVVTWPTNAQNFTLRSTTNLVSPVWITNCGVTVVGDQNTVTNPISGAQMFYQLVQ